MRCHLAVALLVLAAQPSLAGEAQLELYDRGGRVLARFEARDVR